MCLILVLCIYYIIFGVSPDWQLVVILYISHFLWQLQATYEKQRKKINLSTNGIGEENQINEFEIQSLNKMSPTDCIFPAEQPTQPVLAETTQEYTFNLIFPIRPARSTSLNANGFRKDSTTFNKHNPNYLQPPTYTDI